MEKSLISTGEAYGGCVNQRWGGASNAANTGGYINGGSGVVIVRYKFQN